MVLVILFCRQKRPIPALYINLPFPRYFPFFALVWWRLDGSSCARQAVLNDAAQVDKGDNARLSSFVGAIAIADLVKSTLGPKGGLVDWLSG